MYGRLTSLLAGLALGVFATTATADAGPEEGKFYLSPMFSFIGTPDELGYDDSAWGLGGALGYTFSDKWAAELTFLRYDADLELIGGRDSDDIDKYWANALYRFPVDSAWRPFVTLGAGRGYFRRGAVGGTDSIMEFNFGLGAFADLNDRVSLRADVRGVYVHDDVNEIKPFAAIGVAIALGSLAPKTVPDADGDGVPDANDKCPGTPPGRRVDANGCEYDTDGDGVVDGIDACPNTPQGVTVDSRGCPLDSDGDGVPDYVDECPNTPRGAQVDAKGCPIKVTEPVRFDLTVEFAYDSAVINDLSFRELRRAMQFLREHPTTKAVIEGHTDSRGSDEYNQRLSQRRAAAVVDVLTRSGIEASRLSSVGYGESRPLASNDTDEGRQRNRRVSIVVAD